MLAPSLGLLVMCDDSLHASSRKNGEVKQRILPEENHGRSHGVYDTMQQRVAFGRCLLVCIYTIASFA